MMIITSSFYKREETPVRNSFWQSSFGSGVVLLSIASYGLGNSHSSIANWKLVFLVRESHTHHTCAMTQNTEIG